MATIINKEEIPALEIVPAFADRSEEWLQQLQYAVRLGNEFKGKTVITFETTKGPHSVETTIWSVTDDYIVLKRGMHIPLSSIIDLHY